MKKILTMLVVGIMQLWLGGTVCAQGSLDWRVVAFPGQSVGLVQVNESNPNQIAAVVSAQLYVSNDKGQTWLRSLTPYVVRSVSYDQARPGRIAAGTDRGMILSNDFGLTWRILGSEMSTQKTVTSSIIVGEHIFAAMYDGVGTPVKMYRFAMDGTHSFLPYPDSGVTTLAYDMAKGALYAGSQNGVWSSRDKGDSWIQIGVGAGRFSYKIIVKNATLLQISADGLYRIEGGQSQWSRLATPGNLNGTYYGNDMRMTGLGIIGSQIIYGAWSFGYPYKFLALYGGGGAVSEVSTKVNDISSSDPTAWVATENGLWSNNRGSSPGQTVNRPLIVIPGILGSMPVPIGFRGAFKSYLPAPKGGGYQTSLILDPIQGTYDELIEYLRHQGYRPGVSLFSFPYDWRQDNYLSGLQLAQRIFDIRRSCGCQQVDIVAHSMGGLVARAYIQSNFYQNDVANLFMVGTPNAGSLEAYPAWEAGDIGRKDTLLQKAKYALLRIEAYHQQSNSIVSYIRTHVPAIQQLLPVFNYIEGRDYPQGYPDNSFLERLNSQQEVSLLWQRVAMYVIGSESHQTAVEYRATPASPQSATWPHGSILGAKTGPGDGTVPLRSLNWIAPLARVSNSNHGDVMRSPELKQFLGRALLDSWDYPVTINRYVPQNHLVVMVKSPVKLEITDPAGRRLSDDYYDIPDAYYTGSDSSYQFALVPRDDKIRYQIKLTGVAAGEYTLEVWDPQLDPEATSLAVQRADITAGRVDKYVYHSSGRTLIPSTAPNSVIVPYWGGVSVPSLLGSHTENPGTGYELVSNITAFKNTPIAPRKYHQPAAINWPRIIIFVVPILIILAAAIRRLRRNKKR